MSVRAVRFLHNGDMEPEYIRRRPGGGAIVSMGLRPTDQPQKKLRATVVSIAASTLATVLVTSLKVLLAICTFGAYPLAPWAIKVNDRRRFKQDVRREQYRRAVRQVASQQRRRR